MKGRSELYIGLISGTSIDGIDAALVDFSDGTPQLLASRLHPIPKDLKQKLPDLSSALPLTDQLKINRIELMAQVDAETGHCFADAVNQLLKSSQFNPAQIMAVGSHGQTIRHRPKQTSSSTMPFTLQIGDANIISEKTGITTIADFRRADLAAGGQGAPLAPAFHNAILRSTKQNRIILNLGGIANITYLAQDPNQQTIGFDTGPANTLLDAWFKKNNSTFKREFDKNSQFAKTGHVSSALLNSLLEDPYFKLPFPKSTGREYFCLDWLEKHTTKLNLNISVEDIQRTLIALTTKTIVNEIEKLCLSDFQVFACGGGMHNRFLLEDLSKQLDKKILTTNDIGVNGDYLEAMTFAWLAKQRLEEMPSNLPSVTGAENFKILGAVYLA